MSIIEPSQELSDAELSRRLRALCDEKRAVLLSHYYQAPQVQDVADFVGDILDLAHRACDTDADIIVLIGVYFMAETAKMLNPGKKVLIPSLEAGCSLVDDCTVGALSELMGHYPKHKLVSYINCSLEVKAMSHILCTSANAKKVIDSIPANDGIIFAPDRNLGAYLSRETGRELLCWDAACYLHDSFSVDMVEMAKSSHPQALLIAHPECGAELLAMADFVGSTSQLLNFTANSSAEKFIVATEEGILHQMRAKNPEKDFYPICEGSICRYMRLHSLKNIYRCLLEETPNISVDGELARRATVPLERMMAISS